MGGMRLFVAVTPSEEAVEDLADYLAPRQEASAGLRWTDPHQWHVTLAFMPSVPERALDPLTERLAEAAARRPPLRMRVSGAGAFPNPYAARVLFAGVTVEAGELGVLAAGARSACSAAGAAPHGGPFHAHVTLARLGRPTEATRWLRVLEPYSGPAWDARQITLIESHLGEGRGRRPRYEELASLPLG
jgi:2'-5' RNA ligase